MRREKRGKKEDQTRRLFQVLANMDNVSSFSSLLFLLLAHSVSLPVSPRSLSLSSDVARVFVYGVIRVEMQILDRRSHEARCLNFLSDHLALFCAGEYASLARAVATFYERLRTSPGDLLNF